MAAPPLPDRAPSAPITVVVAVGQELLRAGLRMIIDQAPDLEVVGEVGAGDRVVGLLETLRPQVVLLEAELPGRSGLDIVRALAERPDPRPRPVMLTTYHHDQLAIESLRAGVRGYLVKTAPPTMVLDALRAAAGDGTLVSPEITLRLVERNLATPMPVVSGDIDLSSLTEGELRVLHHVARGLSNREIATALTIGEATVKSHMSSILRRLGLRDRVQCVVAAYEAGLVTPGGTTR